MAIYKVEAPDGKILNIEGPEGAAPNEILAYAESIYQAPAPQQPVAQPAAPEEGDFMRGLKSYFPSIRETVGGAQALAGRAFGSEDMMRSGVERVKKAQAEQKSKETDDLTVAWDKGIGSVLTDWLPYQIGSGVGNIAESVAMAGAGALLGATAGGVGAAPGAAAGFFGKQMVKKGIKEAAKDVIEKELAKGATKAEAREAGAAFVADMTKNEIEEQALKSLGRAGGRAYGATAGIGAQAMLHGAGETTSRALQESGMDPMQMDLGSLLPAAGVHAIADFLSEKIMLGSLRGMDLGGLSNKSTGKLMYDIVKGASVTGLKEIPPETLQSVAERYGAKLPLASAEAMSEYINTAGAAFAMSVLPGGIGGAQTNMRGAAQVTPEAAPVELGQPTPEGITPAGFAPVEEGGLGEMERERERQMGIPQPEEIAPVEPTKAPPVAEAPPVEPVVAPPVEPSVAPLEPLAPAEPVAEQPPIQPTEPLAPEPVEVQAPQGFEFDPSPFVEKHSVDGTPAMTPGLANDIGGYVQQQINEGNTVVATDPTGSPVRVEGFENGLLIGENGMKLSPFWFTNLDGQGAKLQIIPPQAAEEAKPTKEISPEEMMAPVEEGRHPLEATTREVREKAREAAAKAGVMVSYRGSMLIDPANTIVDWDKLGKQKTAGAILSNMQDHVPLDYKAIIDRIMPAVKDIPVSINKRVTKGWGGLHSATITTGDQRIQYARKVDYGNTIETVLHEIIHGATVVNYLRGKRGIDPKYKKAAQELDDLAKQVRDLAPARALPFMHSRSYTQAQWGMELIARGMTEREVQEVLKSIKLPDNKSAWTKFTELVAKLLGIPKGEVNAMTRLLEISEQFMEPVDKAAGAGKPVSTKRVINQMENEKFRKWFANSMVVDNDGNPLVMYHNTAQNFSVFDRLKSKEWRGVSIDTIGSWFTDNPEKSDMYAGGEGQNIMPVYLKISKPKIYDSFQDFLKDVYAASGKEMPKTAAGKVDPEALRSKLIKQGYDGIAFTPTDNQELFDQLDALTEKLRQARDAQYGASAEDKALYQNIIKNTEEKIAATKYELDKSGRSTEFDNQTVWVAFNPNQIKSVFNKGEFSPEDNVINQSISPHRSFSGGPAPEPTWGLRPYADMSSRSRVMDDLVYKYLDKHKDMKDVINAIKAAGRKVSATWDAYMKETLYHNRVAYLAKQFMNNELKPLAEAMVKSGITEEQLNNYLLARFAEERNREINIRNDNPALQDRGSGVHTLVARAYLGQLTKAEVAELSKIPGLNENEKKLLADLKTMTPERMRNLQALAKRSDDIVRRTQDMSVAGGIEKQTTIDYWRDKYPNYVPLKRDPDELDFVSSNLGMGAGFSTRAGMGKAAVGSLKGIDNILSNITLQRDMAIMRSEKARIGRALYGLFLQNPNPDFAITVNPNVTVVRKANELYAKIKQEEQNGHLPGSPEYDKLQQDKARYQRLASEAAVAQQKMIEELINSGMVPEGVDPVKFAENMITEPEGAFYNKTTGKVEYRTNSFLRSAPNVLAIPIDGETRYIFFNPADERAMRMIKSLKNLDVEKLGEITSTVAKYTRWIAMVNTQYNPFFGILNMMRDVQGAQFNLSTTALKGQQMAVNAHIMPSMFAIYKSMRNERIGNDTEGYYAEKWHEFQKYGGPTGYKDMLTRERGQNSSLQEEIDKLQETPTKKSARKAFDAIVGRLADLNDGMENAVRLSAFIEAQKKFTEQGLTAEQANEKAAELAKNLTVNFNRKGQKSQLVNSWYAFFNASAQGSARLIETMRGPRGKQLMSAMVLMGVMQSLLLKAAGFDEEDPPAFVREKNIVIPTGGGKYVSWPMPLGFNVFVNFGRIATDGTTDVLFNGGRNIAKNVANMASVISNTFNPFGSSGLSIQTIAPTIVDPLAALSENKDAFGRPIYREDRATNPTPGYLRSRDGTFGISKFLSEAMNRMSGGTEFQKGYISPTADEIEYLAGQLGGGVWREGRKLFGLASDVTSGEETAPYKIPLVGRFYGDTGANANIANRFYENVTQLAKYEQEIMGRAKSGQDYQQFMQDVPEASLFQVANRLENTVSQLNKARKMLKEQGAPESQIKQIDEYKMQLMNSFNDQFQQATKQ